MPNIDPTTFKAEQDGAYIVNIDTKPTRLVEERHLLALKGAHEEKTKGWEIERTTLTTKAKELADAHEATRQSLLQAQAASEQLKEQYKDYDTHKKRVGELSTEVDTHKKSVMSLETDIGNRIKSMLIANGAKEDSLKDKTLVQLRSLEEAVNLLGVGVKRGPANYDRNGGGGGPTAETATERAHRIIEAQEIKQGVRVKVAAQ